MDFIWIFIGIFYVVYKLAKEEQNYAPLFGIIFFFVMSFILGKMIEAGVPSIIIALLCLLSPVVIIGLVFLLHDNNNSEETHSKDIEILQGQFEQSGYYVKRELLETLYENHMSPLYYKNPTVYSCYEWLCKQETNKIISLNSDQLASLVEISLSTIPLNKDRPLDEAYLQRKLTLIEYLLNQQGLRYHDISNDYTLSMRKKYLSSPAYMQEVINAIRNRKS